MSNVAPYRGPNVSGGNYSPIAYAVKCTHPDCEAEIVVTNPQTASRMRASGWRCAEHSH